jgi:glycosyltransferase involved in cell wall biosynthesis
MQEKYPFAMYVHGSEVQKYSSRPFDMDRSLIGILKRLKKDILLVYFMKKFVNGTKLNKLSHFVFPSFWMKDEMENNLNVIIEKFDVIANGIETDMFKFSNSYDKRYRILALRPLSSMKYAVDIAIDIMRFLPAEYSLDIFGKGKYEKTFKELINRYSLQDRINIHNTFINKFDMPDFFSKYGISMSTTRMDAQGVSMCEAMSSGLLTVSNNNTAIPEFIKDMKTGILGESPKELADKILEVTSDQNLFENITLNGRKSMEEINVEITCKEELNILKKIANKK